MTPKWQFWGKITLLMGKISGILQQRTRLTFFWLNFMPICPVTEKCEFTVPLRKTHFFAPNFWPLWPRQVRFQFGLHVCKILSGSVKGLPELFAKCWFWAITSYTVKQHGVIAIETWLNSITMLILEKWLTQNLLKITRTATRFLFLTSNSVQLFFFSFLS